MSTFGLRVKLLVSRKTLNVGGEGLLFGTNRSSKQKVLLANLGTIPNVVEESLSSPKML